MNYLNDEECYYMDRKKDKLNIAIIGCGMIGMEHIQVAALESSANVYGLYDIDGRSLTVATHVYKEVFGAEREPVIYQSLEEAASDSNIGALIICTPNYTHLEILKSVLPYKKHILLEKPMATTVADAREILEISKEYEAVIQIGLQYRYKSIYSLSRKEALEYKSIGEIKNISIMEHRIPFLDKKKQWNKFSEYSGGTLVEKCCHYFDLFNLFARSRPLKVFAKGSLEVNYNAFSYEKKKADIIDNAFVIVEYENGIRASLNLCMFAPLFYEEMVLCGDKGRLKVTEKQDSINELANTIEIHRGEDAPSLFGEPRYPDHIEEKGGHHGSKFFEHRNFIRKIMGEKTDAATVEEGYWSIVVGAAARQSIIENREIVIDDLLI